ncbi:MAG: hypothetical protein NZT61_00690 [Deltaproteobacteria bacterium]|nr:hypothetical protein [Deltaproteobacteria bacterium]
MVGVVDLDFEWPLATKTLKYLDEASKKCKMRLLVVPKKGNSDDLVFQRWLQAFKSKVPALILAIDAERKHFEGVVGPIYISGDFGAQSASQDSNARMSSCISLNDLPQFCQKLPPEITASHCDDKIIKGTYDRTFKILYFLVMLIILALTVFISFFW